MNRLLVTSFLALALMIGATGAAPVAHAAEVEGTPCDYNGVGDGTWKGGKCTDNGTYGYQNTSGTLDQNVTANAAAASTPIDNKASPAEGYNSVMQWIMSIFAWLVGVAALTLDTAVFYTVVTMGDYVHKLSAIGVAWRILRDIGNIMLIFGFLAIGISVILNTERIGYGKKMLPMLLVAAVFLNFSLFFTEAVIDTGNLFATQFYKQINGGNMPTAAFTASATVKNEGISNKLMAQLGLASLYDVNNGKVKTQIFQGSNPSIIGFLGILLFIITAFVMFSLAFILIARFVVLIFLIILAPIGFAGLAVPQLKNKAGQWWSALFQQTITAPVLLLLLYVALAVITDAQFLTGFNPTGETWLGYLNSTDLAGFGGVLLSFLVAMGLLLAVTISAKSLSAYGASAVTKVGNLATAKATKFAMSPVRFAGRTAATTGKWAVRSTAGRGLNYLSNKVKTSAGGEGQFGRLAATALSAAGGKSYVEARDKSVKKHEEYVKSVGAAFDEKHVRGILDASQDKETAKSAQNDITKRHNLEDKPFADEVAKRQKTVNDNVISGKTGFGAMSAKADLIKAEKDLKDHLDLVSDVRKAEKENAEVVFKAADAAEKAANVALSTAKKGAALGYAQNMQASVTQNPLTFLATGAGGHGNTASMKILKDALKVKSDQEKLLDELKKAVAPAPAAPAAGGHTP